MTHVEPAVSTTRWRRETRLSSMTMSESGERPTTHVRSGVIVLDTVLARSAPPTTVTFAVLMLGPPVAQIGAGRTGW
ncbi:MAG TPA: hypothetical protein VE287_10905 [Actinopolymorphaceae bacterium]|nr:hypothetical protein [Actinopolymorphaceae bacterium]